MAGVGRDLLYPPSGPLTEQLWRRCRYFSICCLCDRWSLPQERRRMVISLSLRLPLKEGDGAGMRDCGG